MSPGGSNSQPPSRLQLAEAPAPDQTAAVGSPAAAPAAAPQGAGTSILTSADQTMEERSRQRSAQAAAVKPKGDYDWENKPFQSLMTALGEMGASMEGKESPLLKRRKMAMEEERMTQQKMTLGMQGLEGGIKMMKELPPEAADKFAKYWSSKFEPIMPGFGEMLKQASTDPDNEVVTRALGDLGDTLGPAFKKQSISKQMEMLKDKDFMERLYQANDEGNRTTVMDKVKGAMSMISQGVKDGQIPAEAMAKLPRSASGHVEISMPEIEAMNIKLPPELQLSRSEISTLRRSPDLMRSLGITTPKAQEEKELGLAKPQDIDVLTNALKEARRNGDTERVRNLQGKINAMNHVPDERTSTQKEFGAFRTAVQKGDKDAISFWGDKLAKESLPEIDNLYRSLDRAKEADQPDRVKQIQAMIDTKTTGLGATEADLKRLREVEQARKTGGADAERAQKIPPTYARLGGFDPNTTRGELMDKGITILPESHEELKGITDSQASVRSTVRMLDDLVTKVQKNPTALSNAGNVANWVQGLKTDVAGFVQLAGGNPNTILGKDNVAKPLGEANDPKNDGLWKSLGVQNAEQRALIWNLGYGVAAVQNKGRVTEPDFQNAVKQVAADAKTPAAIIATTQQMRTNMIAQWQDTVEAKTGFRPMPPTIPPDEQALVREPAKITSRAQYDKLSQDAKVELARRYPELLQRK